MSDIVERLNDKWRHSEEDCYAAAAEITRLRDELANCRAAALEEAATAVERRAVEIGRQECCGFVIGSPPECCGDPLYMISDRHAAAAIRALSPSPAAPSKGTT